MNQSRLEQVVRYLLVAMLAIFGANMFLHFVPQPAPPEAGVSAELLASLPHARDVVEPGVWTGRPGWGELLSNLARELCGEDRPEILLCLLPSSS